MHIFSPQRVKDKHISLMTPFETKKLELCFCSSHNKIVYKWSRHYREYHFRKTLHF